MARKVVARAPVRLDFAGGWTDVSPYTHDIGGEVVNLAINKYATATLEVDDDGILSVSYTCEVPVGSGLGTTGAINVALMGAIKALEIDDDGRSVLAEQAFQFESLLGNKGGRQDQWAASHGGWNHLMFMQDSVEEMPLSPISSSTKWLQRQLIVVNSNITHVSGDLHKKIWERYDAGDEEVKEGLMAIRLAARGMAKAVQQDRRDELIHALNEVCRGVDLLDKGLHEPFLGVLDPLLSSKDVLAWKALGAGGGGCAMLLCNLGRRDAVEAACEAAGWTLVDWAPDMDGLTITSS
ncbi:MAG: hypothetical protein HOE69_05570 [Euryarchaeota archaeon]|jgi:D-glycero-alpha-D-manno-heptose-7-phosphate kinase|nr:hypothetical protein [Euryarchaeota archaeon]